MAVRATNRYGRVCRRALLVGLVVGVTTLGAVALPASATTLEEPGDWAPVGTATVHPGVQTVTDGGACTGNFIYTNGSEVFIGQAAHCSADLSATDTEPTGCTAPVHPIGTPVQIMGASKPGRLAYSSFNAMQAVGETNPDVCAYNDFALVEIHPDDLGKVNPSMPAFGGPAALDTDGIGASERVFGYGNSPDRMGLEPLKPSSGVSAGDLAGGRAHNAFLVPPVIPGDSGGPYVTGDGSAFGSLIGVQLAPAPPGATLIADVAQALAYADEHGDVGTVKLVPGTEPFSPALLPGLGR